MCHDSGTPPPSARAGARMRARGHSLLERTCAALGRVLLKGGEVVLDARTRVPKRTVHGNNIATYFDKIVLPRSPQRFLWTPKQKATYVEFSVIITLHRAVVESTHERK